MAEQQKPNTFEPGVRSLYVKKLSRLSFHPIGELREALLRMYSEEARHQMGQSALFLYSQPQVDTYRPNSSEHRESEQRDSNLRKRLGTISTRQFELAKWVGLVPGKNQQSKTGFRFNVLLDTDTQIQLHAGVNEGLNQSLFGRRAIFATHWIPDKSMVSTEEEWLYAKNEIKRVIWGNDDVKTPSTTYSLPAKGGSATVTHINWTSPPTSNPEGKVA